MKLSTKKAWWYGGVFAATILAAYLAFSLWAWLSYSSLFDHMYQTASTGYTADMQPQISAKDYNMANYRLLAQSHRDGEYAVDAYHRWEKVMVYHTFSDAWITYDAFYRVCFVPEGKSYQEEKQTQYSALYLNGTTYVVHMKLENWQWVVQSVDRQGNISMKG